MSYVQRVLAGHRELVVVGDHVLSSAKVERDGGYAGGGRQRREYGADSHGGGFRFLGPACEEGFRVRDTVRILRELSELRQLANDIAVSGWY